ncbi:MAG: DNA recombination protein RmuC [Candidatus Doudnabacteria bacterium]|nr:DNA recombination protein RmuC [Candidatus Doudnabacteria bacterium]
MNPAIVYPILAILVAGFGIALYFLMELKKRSDKPQDDASLKVMMEWMKEIKQGTEQTREGMQKSIDETNKAINERLDNAGRVIAALTKELGGISQVGPDIRRLTETLASPKLRGNFGEEMLENMLSQALPKNGFAIQYKFKNGEVVDAIIYVGEKILPIDSKFSMENFRLYKEAKTEEAADGLKKAFLKDVKKRVDEIHKKYILPQEGTFDFALMYIPSEGVFSEVLDDGATLTYARDKKVYYVSPNTLYHHLQIILLSLRGQKINQAAQQILAMIAGIKQESEKFGRSLDVLGNHIKNAGNTMGTVANDYLKLKTSITNASGLKLEETVEAVKTPEPQRLLD